MSAHGHHIELQDPGAFSAPGLTKASFALIGAGVLGLILSLIPALGGGVERFWSSLLQGMLIPLYLGLAGLFFIAVHNITGAQWLTPYRRIIEGMTASLPVGLITALVIALIGSVWLYDYAYLTHPAFAGEEEKMAHKGLFHVKEGSKTSYMTWIRLVVMNAVFIGLWWFMHKKIIGKSLAQDTAGGALQKSNFRTSLVYLFVFALGITFFTWDYLLALHVNWFSTMWGVYCFSSAMQTFLCVLVIFAMWMKSGPLKDHLPQHVVHDLGTWMVAWSCFCAYIGFDQFMLIYYANLDEETFYYIMRTQNGYGWQYAIEALLRWPLPFLALMSQKVRTNPKWLVAIACAVLLGNWMDWSWIIMPAFSPNAYRSPFEVELLVGAGFAGAFLLMALRFWAKHGIVPKNDPYLESTVNGEHLH